MPAQSQPPASMRAVQMASWSGPLPPAVFLREYEESFPGAGERILKSFEIEGEHRRKLDTENVAQNRLIVEAHVWVMKVGLVTTTVVAVAGFIVAAILAMQGEYKLAAAIGGGDLVGLTLLGWRRKTTPNQLPPPSPQK